jgi:tungstate transport system ATP-binding protein
MKIQGSGITKVYNHKTVLDIDNFTFKSGEFWGIIGPNGSGKSTLLRLISKLTEPSSGKILYELSDKHQTVKRSMTLVFQKPYLLRTSVYNNIAYPLQIRQVHPAEIKRKVEEMLISFEIENLADQKAWTLSGGEAQKVALARALVFNPELIMLDEPTANIDPASIMLLENRLRLHYQKFKPTVLMVTHNLQQTKRLCNKVAFLHEGNIHDHGSIDHVFGPGGTSLVKSFIQQGLI